MASSLQRFERTTETVSQILAHAQADDYVRLLCAVSMLSDGGEAHTNEPFIMGKFGEQIDVQRLYPVIENDEPIIAVSDFPYGAGHVFSIRKTVKSSMNPLPPYLLTAIAEYDDLDGTCDPDELASAFERMKEAIGKAIVEAEGEAA